jgi:hypothetical protein
MEKVYADYANSLKALGNDARKAAVNTKDISYSPTAAKTYAPEVKSLNKQLLIAKSNAPLERKAQVLANSISFAKQQANPNMDPDRKKRVKNEALAEARVRVGAKKTPVTVSDREWEAIQSGAITKTALTSILRNTDQDALKEKALPRTKNTLSPQKEALIRARIEAGYTQAEVAAMTGLSNSTIQKAIG